MHKDNMSPFMGNRSVIAFTNFVANGSNNERSCKKQRTDILNRESLINLSLETIGLSYVY